jgi:hypothetical protein
MDLFEMLWITYQHIYIYIYIYKSKGGILHFQFKVLPPEFVYLIATSFIALDFHLLFLEIL